MHFLLLLLAMRNQALSILIPIAKLVSSGCADRAFYTLNATPCTVPYFEYSSTISCSLTGRLMSSLFGSDSTFPLSVF